MKKKSGKVFLVGAGPGDVGLITKRGDELLKRADVVLVDALVNPHLLHLVKGRIIYAGKRGPGAPLGSYIGMAQSKINILMVKLAREGKRVVRLKGGDPFLFGRGSEELEALKRASVRYEIVPGVSSAMAVPAYAGIPITDRRWASQVSFVTGSEDKEKEGRLSGVDWKRLSPKGTLVFLMGVSRWPHIRRKLLDNGWNKNVPVAAIESGTTARQRTLLTTLEISSDYFQRQNLVSPSVIVVGPVAQLHQTLSWIERERPLLGRRIMVTRPPDQSSEFISMLEDKGAEVYSCPSLQIQPVKMTRIERSVVDKIKKDARVFDWVILLSKNAVENFSLVLGDGKEALKKSRIIAVGPKTAAAIRAAGWPVKRIAKNFNSFGVVKALGNVKEKKILIPRVQNASSDLAELLKKRGAKVTEMTTYKTIPLSPSPKMRTLAVSGIDAITFTSGSSVRYFLSSFTSTERAKVFSKAVAVSIGPMTTSALNEFRIPRVLETPYATTEGMVTSLCKHFRAHP